MSTRISGSGYILTTCLSTCQQRALTLWLTTSAGCLTLIILGSLAEPFCFRYLLDQIGRRPAFMAFLVLQACNGATYLLGTAGSDATVLPSFFLDAPQGGLAARKGRVGG